MASDNRKPITNTGNEKMTKAVRPLEVMKLENGSLAVRWSNSQKKWAIVTDETMIQFIIFSMIA